MTDTTTTPAVYRAIVAVMADMARDGIAKDRNNAQQGYKFRGIDDVYNALSGALSRHGLAMLPTVEAREMTEGQTAKGSPLFNVVCRVRFDLVASEDGSSHSITTYGEAMDMADKATNKAMSAAYKYAAMQAFCIPTEGDNDADAHTPEPAPRRQAPAPAPRPSPAPAQPSGGDPLVALAGVGWPAADVTACGLVGDVDALRALYAAARDGLRPDHLGKRIAKRLGQASRAGVLSATLTDHPRPAKWSHDLVTKIRDSLPHGDADADEDRLPDDVRNPGSR
jgi:hypothetical protein